VTYNVYTVSFKGVQCMYNAYFGGDS